jgi:hypothetical protein
MIERAYADKKFEDAQVIRELSLGVRLANRHAGCIVLNLMIKSLDLILGVIDKLKLEEAGLLNNDVKAIYAQCARFYVADLVFYTALIAPDTDIFYQIGHSADWTLLKSVYRVHYFPDGHKIVRAYCAFFDYIALANAVTSKQDES